MNEGRKEGRKEGMDCLLVCLKEGHTLLCCEVLPFTDIENVAATRFHPNSKLWSIDLGRKTFENGS